MAFHLLWHQGFHLQTINSERLPIPEIRQPFKMEESQFNKFKEDKLRVLLALETKELLQPQGETMQLVKQRQSLRIQLSRLKTLMPTTRIVMIDPREIDTLKDPLSTQVKEKESLSTTLTVFKTECKEKESKYMDKKIVLENQNKELECTLFVVTPMNKDKKVRFVGPVTSSSNIPKKIGSLRIKDSNKPLLTSTGVNTTISASGSKPSGNRKKNRISRPPSSNQMNKVKQTSKKVKSSLNKTNSIFEPISNAHVNHSVRDAKFDSICDICRSLTIVGNKYPLTRITSTNEVPFKETTITQIITQSPTLKVYNRKPKASRSVGSSSKAKIVEYKTSNTKEPKQSWGSIVFDVPSSFIIDYRFSKLFCGIWTLSSPSI
uniref:Uncharacterized protein n=1 Tax=Tanacetum cinerariifolium TaxID=118510 RepID=A0A699HH15_TANCI|nr:hypothetical protein [Tanacetum cinerariifolium]